jgi:hypothetical protein
LEEKPKPVVYLLNKSTKERVFREDFDETANNAKLRS